MLHANRFLPVLLVETGLATSVPESFAQEFESSSARPAKCHATNQGLFFGEGIGNPPQIDRGYGQAVLPAIVLGGFMSSRFARLLDQTNRVVMNGIFRPASRR
jgi:hypothetical protein